MALLRGGRMEERDLVIKPWSFMKENRQVVSSHHNRPLYLTAYIHNVELWRIMDLASSLNIMPFSTLEMMEIPQDRVVKQLVNMLSFGGNASFPLSFSNLDLTVAPMKQSTNSQQILCNWCPNLLSFAAREVLNPYTLSCSSMND